ncbi:hypothetical protein D8O05_29320 [Burkholderia mallei]|nr:hypothetical protein D8O05_29320 [Burkholderia mallei]
MRLERKTSLLDGSSSIVKETAREHAIVVGWHGDRYWDGHRYWERREWEERHRRRGFCPPGHAKKGEC